MSRQYDDPKAVPDQVLAERLERLSHAVTEGAWDEFTMRIPVEVDRDADIVLQEAARRLRSGGQA